MATLLIKQHDLERLREIAAGENRPVEEVVSQMIEDYAKQRSRAGQVVYQRIEDDPRYQAAERELMPKYHARARKYWAEVGDHERLALTEEQFAAQFWLFDGEGIPRLKADQGDVHVPFDSLEEAAEDTYRQAQIEGRLEEMGIQAVDTRAILENEFPKYLLQRMEAQPEDDSSAS
jgi:hypothetical protein